MKKENTKKKEIKENPIAITKHYLGLLKDFESIGNNTKVRSLGRLTNQRQCPLCFEDLKPNLMTFFKCNRHKACKKCMSDYKKAGFSKNNKFLCVFRCSKRLWIKGWMMGEWWVNDWIIEFKLQKS